MTIFNVKVTENDTFKVIPKALNSFDIKTVQRIYTYGASDFGPIVALGGESLNNGNFDSDALKWSLVNYFWNNGALDVNNSVASATQDVGDQQIALIPFATYRTSITISNRVSGSIRLSLTGSNGTTRSGDGTFVEDIVNGNGTQFSVFAVGGVINLTIDSISCKLIGLADQTVSIDAQKDVDISGVFSDPDIGNRELGIIDKLIITASSGNRDQCGVSVFENSSGVLQLRLTGYAAGTPTITLTATDISGNTTTTSITVTVS